MKGIWYVHQHACSRLLEISREHRCDPISKKRQSTTAVVYLMYEIINKLTEGTTNTEVSWLSSPRASFTQREEMLPAASPLHLLPLLLCPWGDFAMRSLPAASSLTTKTLSYTILLCLPSILVEVLLCLTTWGRWKAEHMSVQKAEI